jgi:hypothetical protein
MNVTQATERIYAEGPITQALSTRIVEGIVAPPSPQLNLDVFWSMAIGLFDRRG